MLKITIPPIEYWDPEKEEFISTKQQSLQLEHSLVSLSKWEAKWNKPFLGRGEKTREEMQDYIRCMTLTQSVDPEVYTTIPENVIQEISDYIEAPMTATTFNGGNRAPGREIITSELIYYWMISLGIPFECQKWHLNRLMTLIKVCSIKNGPQKKMSKREIFEQNRKLNEARRRAMNSSG